jgi:hypothetical protein
MKVLYSDKLKYGEFLHHLGMDFLTKQGIPNPLLPTHTLFSMLRGFGVSASTAQELLTINLSKLLGGGLALLVAGHDVYTCFADTIPHTFTAAGYHLGIGMLDLVFGNFPPNPFLLLAGGSEIVVGSITGIRTIRDMISPQTLSVLDTAAIYFPTWAAMTTLSALLGVCVGYWSGRSWSTIAKAGGIQVVASGVTASISGALAGNFIAPFIGGFAGFAAGLLLRRIFMEKGKQHVTNALGADIDFFNESAFFTQHSSFFDQYSPFFDTGAVLPIRQLPKEPIGMLKDDKLLINPAALDQFNT